MTTTAVRLFVAINLPPSERQAIHRATAALRDAAGTVTWVAPECIHLTMKFLGEQPPESVTRIRDALDAIARRFQPFRLDVGGLGAFPHLRAPKIFWMGIASEPKLELLHHDLEVACEALGHEVDARAFRPHLTLGRVRGRPAYLFDLLPEDAGGPKFPVRHVELVESTLTPDGAVYETVGAFALGEESRRTS